jgi:hypothetical protein
VIRSDHVMTALDYSRKRAAPPNPPRIRGDVCGSKWRPENNHFAQITSPDPAATAEFFGVDDQLEKQKDAEDHDVSFAGGGGKVL